MKTLLCDCNQTLPLNREGLIKALGPQAAEGIADKHSLLCRREAGAFQRAAKGGEDLFIACTQEQPLFEALTGETEGALKLNERPIRFFNLREMAGWGEGGKAATPKMAALIAAAQLPPPEPVGTVAYESQGRCLIIGPAEAAQGLAPHLAGGLQVTLLVEGGAQAQTRAWAVHAGRLKGLTGWLGTFEATWEQGNPIDLDVCTRCNACVQACPEGAIGLDYQVDLNACKSHRSCVAVCEVAAAIDFNRAVQERQETFDVVIDMRRDPAFGQHQPPQGYFHVGLDATRGLQAALQARDMVGTFDKPRFFQYKRSVCAHSRNEQTGCTACVDVCSASAVRSDREGTGGIIVEPHLCVGCGACTTACPTGALSYATPDAATQGKRLRTVLSTYQRAGGQGAA
jgi:ferredoxin